MNITFLIGNLTKKPELVKGLDKSLCKLILAVRENYTDADGNRPTQFFNVAVWGKLAENCVKYLDKGSKIAVLGKTQNRRWEDAEGQKHYAIEVVANEIEFLNAKSIEKDTKLQAIDINEENLPF